MTIRDAISSLTQLEVVGTFTSELVFSLAHGNGTEGVLLDPKANPLLWSGECDHHANALLRGPSVDIYSMWVKAKTGQGGGGGQERGASEARGSSIRYCHLPGLKRVEWYFYTPEKLGRLVRTGGRKFAIAG